MSSLRVQAALSRSKRRGSPIVLLSNFDWNDAMFQRPHQLARAFADEGHLVFFVTPNRLDRCNTLRRQENDLYLCPSVDLVSRLQDPIVYILRPQQRRVVARFRSPVRLIYDFLDDLELTIENGDSGTYGDHQWLLKNATTVAATADRLYFAACEERPDTLFSPNAVDASRFRPGLPLPEDLRALAGRPIIGYHGALAEWFDYSLLKAVAGRCADLNFVLIGREFGTAFRESGCESVENLHFIGSRPNNELPAYCGAYSVALIPFLVNRITLSTSPVKLFEYLACGKPVVSTPLPECRKYRGVTIAAEPMTFCAAIRGSLSRPPGIEDLREEALRNSWMLRAREMVARAMSGQPVRAVGGA